MNLFAYSHTYINIWSTGLWDALIGKGIDGKFVATLIGMYWERECDAGRAKLAVCARKMANTIYG